MTRLLSILLFALPALAQLRDGTLRDGVLRSAVQPETLPVSGALVWLHPGSLAWTNREGTVLATADGDRVGKWQDKSGNNNHAYYRPMASFESRLQITNSSLAGFRALNSQAPGNPTPGWLTTHTNLSSTDGGLTVFAVAQFEKHGSPGFNELVSAGAVSSLDGSFLFRNNGTQNGMQLYVDGSDATATAGLVTGQYYVFAARFLDDGNTLSVWTNGVSHATGAAGAAAALPAQFCISIAYRPAVADSTDLHWERDILEVIVYGSALSNTDVTTVNNYLLQKFGLP